MKYIYLILTALLFCFNNLVAQDNYYLYAFGDPAYLYEQCDDCDGFDCSGCDEDDPTNSSSLVVYDIVGNELARQIGTSSTLYRDTFITRPYRIVYRYSTSSLGSGTYTVILDANNDDACISSNSHPEEDYGLSVSLYDFREITSEPTKLDYCNEDEFELKADKDCSNRATYDWIISTDGGLNYSSTGISTSTNEVKIVSLSDILPDENYIGNMTISANASVIGVGYVRTNSITYQISSCSPQLLRFEEKNATCSNSNDAGFDMILDRPVDDNKKLVVSLFFEDKFNPGSYALVTQEDAEGDEVIQVGTNQYSYTWPEGIDSGTYKVRYQTFNKTTENPVWDSLEGTENGFTINPPSPVTFTTTQTDIKCDGETGSIRINASGGSGSFEFQQNGGNWSSFVSGYTISGLTKGSTHTIKVRDSKECIAQEGGNDKVDEISFSSYELISISETITEPTSNGGNNGSIVLTTNGGAGDYEYSWSTISGTTDVSSETGSSLDLILKAGVYKVIVTDDNGCTAEKTFDVEEPEELIVAIEINSEITCFGGSNGSLLIDTVDGGVSPYVKYEWFKNGSLYSTTSSTLTGLSTGEYYLRVTDSNGITKDSNKITLNQPNKVTFTATKGNDVSCNGGSDGIINLTASGGSNSFQYQLDGGTYKTFTSQITGLSAGVHTIKIKDSKNCTGYSGTNDVVSVTIDQPAELNIEDAGTYSVDLSAPNADDGEISISISGGTASYTYTLNDSSATPVDGEINSNASITFSGLEDGSYEAIVTDINGCQDSKNFTIGVTEELQLGTITVTPITCNLGSNGALTVTPTGGTKPYKSYVWAKVDGSALTIKNDTTQSLSSSVSVLSVGTYKVTVTDSRGVTKSKTIVLSQPLPVTFTAEKETDILCDGETGSIRLTASGGSGSFQYQRNSESWTTFSSGTVLSGFGEGSSHTIKVRDSAGCIAQENGDDKEVSISFPSYAPITFSGTATPATGNGKNNGSINITGVSGGSGGYTYKWSNDETDKNLKDLPAGNYSLIVSDSNGCSSASVSFEVKEPEELTVSISETSSITCNGGNGRLTASGDGGVVGSGYSYTWYEVGNSSSIGTGTTLNRVAGDYYVVIADNSTKVNTTTSSVFTLNQPTPVTFTATKELDIKCDGETGSIRIDAFGGSGTYQYAFVENSFLNELPDWKNFITSSTSQIIPNLKENKTYVIRIKDSEDCTAKNSDGSDKEVTISFPSYEPITFEANTTPATGFGVDDGSITITELKGGYLDSGDNYVYKLNNAVKENLTGLSAGIYKVVVSDSNGCSSEEVEVEVTQPNKLTISITETIPVICNGDKGQLAAAAAGGVEGTGYKYTWYNSSNVQQGTGETLNALAGDYYVSVEDANGNITYSNASPSANFSLDEPALLNFTAVKEVAIKCDGETGSIKLTASGGSGSFQYQNNGGPWIAFKSGVIIPNFSEGSSNTIKVRDEASITDCIAKNNDGSDKEVTIDFSTYEPIEIIGNITPATGNGVGNGKITITGVSEGSGSGYTYRWSNEATTRNLTNLLAGTYSLIVSDGNGCNSASVSFEVTEPDELIVSISETSSIICNAGTGELTALGSGGTEGSGYSYTWYNSSDQVQGTGATLSVGTGSYYVIIVDKANPINTKTSDIYILNEPTPVTFTAKKEADIKCDGETGSIKLTASGGSGSFQYQNNGGSWVNFTSGTIISNLTEGSSNTIKVRDTSGSSGCIAKNNDGIDKEVNISFLSYNAITFSGNITPATGNGLQNGNINITRVSGGSGGYTYSWSNGATTQDLSGLLAGTYSLIVSDSNGCNSASVSYEVTEPDELTVSISETSSIVCNAGTGTLKASSLGGFLALNEVYTHTWYNSLDEVQGSGEELNNVYQGTYYVVVKDSNGNKTTSSNFILKEPTKVQFTASVQNNVYCKGGSDGQIQIEGLNSDVGNYEYTYKEKSSGNTIQDWTDFSSTASNTTEIIAGLSAGTYIIEVRDGNECTGFLTTGESSIELTIEEPNKVLTIDAVNSNNPDEFEVANGSIVIDVSGGLPYDGTAGYNVTWTGDTNNTGVLSIEDDKITISNLLEGDYVVTIRNGAYGSSAEISNSTCEVITSTIKLIEPEELVVTISSPNIKCFGATATITANPSGGVSGTSYRYQWFKDNVALSGATSISLQNQESGIYKVEVTDDNSITKTSNEITLSEPTKVLYTTSVQNNVYCKGGSDGQIQIEGLNSDVGSYQYTYKEKSTGNTIQGWTGFSSTASNAIEIIAGLSAGTYIIEVRDGNECTGFLTTGESSIELTIEEPNKVLTIDAVNFSNPDEFEVANGSIVIDVSGGLPYDGTAGYSVTWTGDTNNTGVLSIKDDKITIANLLEGDYVVTIRNGAYGSSAEISNSTCEVITNTIKLIEPEKLEVNISIEEDIKCYGDLETIVLKANPIGGVQNTNYQYEWFQVNDVTNPTAITSLGVYTQTIPSLSAGIYKVKVTDDNGISVFSENADLSGPTKVTIDDTTVTQLTCYGINSGEIQVTVSGGTVSGAYKYVWDYESFAGENSSLTTEIPTRTDLAPGNYTLTVVDDNNCTSDEQTFIINALPVFDVSSVSLIRPSEGASDGSITIEITGGIAPHTYQWSKKNTLTGVYEEIIRTSTEETGLDIGDYAVVITDAIGCTHREEYSLKNPGELIADIEETKAISCFDGSDGELYVEAVGGSGGNTYTWYNALDDSVVGTNSQYLKNVSVGSYYVIVNDADGVKEQSPTYTIKQPTAVTLVSSSLENLSCFESEDGTISLEATGGTGSYSYRVKYNLASYSEWTAFNESKTTQLDNLSAGDYEIQIRDTNSCYYEEEDTKNTIVIAIEITEPDFLEISNSTVTNLTGFELSNGSVVTTVIGGTEPYTYVWTNSLNEIQSSITNIIENIPADIYTITITDAQGCATSETYEVTQPDLLEISISQETFILCNGDASADLLGNATGGSGGNIYTWYNAENEEIGNAAAIYNLVAGDYYVKVVDSNNNQATTPIFTVTEPTAIVASSSSVNLSCFESRDGSIRLEANGGTGAYTYRVNQDGAGYGSNIPFTNANETTLENLVAGNYQIQIQDANGCYFEENDLPDTITIEITEPDFLEISNYTITNLTGFELSNGSIETTVIGGTEPYTYVWTNSSNEIQSSTTNVIENISADIYTINITDAQGCTTRGTYEVTQPDLLEISISQETFILCNGDASADLLGNATGGSGENVYTWYNAENEEIGNAAAIYNLVAGDYYVKVVDSNNNQATTPIFTVTEPTAIVASSSSVNLSCFESRDGSIRLEANGGTGTYTYRVNQDGAGYGSNIPFTNANETTLENLVAGNYQIQIQDANGCYFEENDLPKTITIEVTQPNFLEISNNTITNLTGFELSNGLIVTTVIGGTEPYTYVWTSSSNEIQSSTTNIIENISADIYTITITDAQGCTTRGTYEVTQPDLLEISISQETFILCNGDASANLQGNATGGSGGNHYTWYNSSNNVVASTRTAYSLVAGDYYVKVVDSNNNEAITPIFTVTEPTAIVANSSSVNLSCFESRDGSIRLEATGGTGIYTYRVNQDGTGYGSNIPFTSANATTLENLVAGNYQIQIQDANGCYFEENDLPKTFSVAITQPNLLEIANSTVTNLTGFELSNGAIAIEVIGGTESYTYVWRNEARVVQASTTNNLENIPAGIYTVNITDAQGCAIQATYEVTQPDLLEISISQETFISCNGNASATLKASTSGGSGGNIYTWYTADNEEIGNSLIMYNLIAGDYYIRVVDSNTNQATSPVFTVTQPDILATTLESTYVSCGTGNDWKITATTTGGTLPYSYRWSNGATTASIENVTAGNYFVVIEDINGCRIVENHHVIVPEVLAVETNVKELYCASSCEGEIALTITGGIAPYSIEWNTGATTPTISDLCAGNYMAIITDQKGCKITQEFTIEDPAVITVDLEEDKTLCSGQYHQIDIGINDANASYYWESDNGFTSSEASVILTEGGVYTATVTTGSGCVGSDTIEIKTSAAGINAQFLITSQAFAGEDIILVNTSNPISEEIEWLFPNGVEVVDTDGVDTITLRFEEAGAYEIILRSIEGNCYEDYEKTVIVGEAQDIPDIGDAEDPFIMEFNNYPNPTSGNFEVQVELKEEAMVSLRLFSLISNVPIDTKMLNGQKEYNVNYDLSLPTGVYFLLLETAKETEIRKIVVE